MLILSPLDPSYSVLRAPRERILLTPYETFLVRFPCPASGGGAIWTEQNLFPLEKNMKMRLLMAVCLVGLTYGSANADVINVLWYTAGDYSAGQELSLHNLSAQSLSASATPENTLNITFWEPGTPMPGPASLYNTLVVGSPQGGWPTSSPANYSTLDAAFAAGSLPLGSRLMATGQDADWHYLNFPGGSSFNGPQGFLIDSIDWSGSGTGLGAVFLGGADIGEGSSGALSHLPGSLGPTGGGSNEVDIPTAFASFPINSGLTSAGLSGWGTSAHSSWNSADTSVWTVINVSSLTGGVPSPGALDITLVTNGASGGLSAAAPEPASMTLAGMGLVALLGYARRRRQRAEVA